MTNVAYADFEAQNKCNDPHMVEIENGYIRLANELYEALIIADLTKNQAKVAHAICRKTYGFNKKTDRITDIQIGELTNLPRQKVNKAKNELIAMKVIVKNGFKIGINKNISDWTMPNCHQNSDRSNQSPKQGQCHRNSDKNVTKTVTNSGCHQNDDIVTKTGTKSVTETVTALSPKQGHTKDTITKNKKDNIYKPPQTPPLAKSKSFDPSSVELPVWLPKPTWDSWVQYRKEINKPIKSQQTVIQAIKLLGKCRDNGHQPEKIINASIANGWQGLFEPQQTAKPRATSLVNQVATRPSSPAGFIVVNG